MTPPFDLDVLDRDFRGEPAGKATPKADPAKQFISPTQTSPMSSHSNQQTDKNRVPSPQSGEPLAAAGEPSACAEPPAPKKKEDAR